MQIKTKEKNLFFKYFNITFWLQYIKIQKQHKNVLPPVRVELTTPGLQV